MSKSEYGLKFENKIEDCVERMKNNHIFLTENTKLSLAQDPKLPHNLLIEGENYSALKILSYTHAGKVDVIYIDPPYNTGNEDFVYNDKFVDQEDTFRHSKWLSFMSKRLELACDLLSERGVIFISIDDNEFAQLKMLCDQIFGDKNYVCNFTWQTKQAARGVPPRNMLIMNTEYVLCYCKSNDYFRFSGDIRTEEGFNNSDNDPRGLWRSESMKATGKQNNYFDIVDPETGMKYNSNWAFSYKSIMEMISERKIIFPKKSDGTPRQKKFIDSYTNDTKAITTALGWYSTENATKDLMNLFDGEKMFDNPKPMGLIKYLLQQGSHKNSVILDFFAGSGTTGQAVAELNKDDGGTRQFILITNNDVSDKLPLGICTQVTLPRLQKTIGNENLKYYNIESIAKSDNGIVTSIAQLEIHNRLVPILCIQNNTFELLEKDIHSQLFTNHQNDKHLAIWSNTNGKQKAVNPTDLSIFQKKLKRYSNLQLEVNRPRRGFANDYFTFMSNHK